MSRLSTGQVATTITGGDGTAGVNSVSVQDQPNHEAALRKLASLQEGLIGGEKAGK